MSNADPHPAELVCAAGDTTVNVEIITARDVPLGGPRAMTVHRTLPQRRRSLIGAWCFCDHYGPDPIGATGGMDVAPHPHTGLQTVSWLFEGEIRHDDSNGVHERVRPGEVNLMTAGAGICHSEVSTEETEVLHGVQLWTVLPESARHGARRFDHYVPEPVEFEGGNALVFLGSALGSMSPVETFTPLLGAEIRLNPGASLDLVVDPAFEHGVLVDTGTVTVEEVVVRRTELAYTGTGANVLHLSNSDVGPARVIVLGGEPFSEPVVMWWNFIGRDDAEIRRYREEWNAHDERFGEVIGYVGHDPEGLDRLPAPTIPGARVRARVNPAAVARPGDDPYRPYEQRKQEKNMSQFIDKTGVQVAVRLNDKGNAYAIYVDGAGRESEREAGAAYFFDRQSGQGSERIFYHTIVGEAYGGRGLAGILVGEALARTVDQGFTVVPVCPFVRSWTEKNSWGGPLRLPDEDDIAYVSERASE